MLHAAGWIIPLAYLLANERIRGYGCDSLQSAASFFTKVPLELPPPCAEFYRVSSDWTRFQLYFLFLSSFFNMISRVLLGSITQFS